MYSSSSCYGLATLLLLTLVIEVAVQSQGKVETLERLYLSNLNASCTRCLCVAATDCKTLYCANGYCGPFHISRIYWTDAGKIVFPSDDPQRDKAWEDCALDYRCASEIVTRYMSRFGRDCNGDGRTDCDDYASLHFNGGYSCMKPIDNSNFGRRYYKCRPTL